MLAGNPIKTARKYKKEVFLLRLLVIPGDLPDQKPTVTARNNIKSSAFYAESLVLPEDML